MSNYAIGDIQGCFSELIGLLDLINFDKKRDRLWLTGDLVNRGPESLKTLEFIYSIRDSCNIVLGNHDLHLLSIAEGLKTPNKEDTLNEVFKSKMVCPESFARKKPSSSISFFRKMISSCPNCIKFLCINLSC